MKERRQQASFLARKDTGNGRHSKAEDHAERTTPAHEGSAAASGPLDTLHDPAAIVDQKLQVVSVNAPFEELISNSTDSVVGRHLLKVVPALDVQAILHLLRRLTAGEIDSGEDQLRSDEPGGAQLLSVKAHRLGKDMMGGNLLITITKLQAGERPVAPDESALQTRPLPISLALTSHDLRQPLQTLSLLQGLMTMNAKDAKLQQWIARVGDALSALTGTLDALACMSELQRNAIEPHLTNHEMNAVLDRLRPMLGYYAEARGLEWYIASSHAIARSDPRLLEQLLRALLLHAMKLLRTGTVLIGCRLKRTTLRVEIRISGMLVSYHQQQTILDEFNDHLLEQGIVASFAKPLAELLGISLWARPHPGQGLVITADVPTSEETGAWVSRETPEANSTASGTKAVILIISDDTAVRDMLAVLIRTFGYATVTITSLDDESSSVQKDVERIDLIVADLSSYSDDAYLHFLYGLRGRLETQPPAIVFTSEGAAKLTQKTIDGPIVCLRKPVDTEKLKLSIAEILHPAREKFQGQEQYQDAHPSSTQTIYVVEDDAILRDTLQGVFKGTTAKFFANCESFLSEYGPSLSGCLVVDNVMAGMSGVELLERLAAKGSRLPAVMVTGHGDIPTAVRAMRAGAVDFIEKPVTYDVLMTAIQRALHIEQRDVERHSPNLLLKVKMATLTLRERQVMNLVVHGFSNKAIARRLSISRRTVENHRASVMRKMGAASLPELTRMVLELGVLEDDEDGHQQPR